MGYTHYFTQTQNFTKKQWADVCADVGSILKDVQHVQGVPLANGEGKKRTQPVITADLIVFNGSGDDRHETLLINRIRPPKEPWAKVRGDDFCKTARKPYDLAVTAVLAYLSTVTETHRVTTDGSGSDWLAGVEEARRALPRYANVLDIPMDIMRDDRWVSPWVSSWLPTGFEVHFCIDGCGYVLRPRTGESYCFESHMALAKYLQRTQSHDGEPNIWNAYGGFDKNRYKRLRDLQVKELRKLFPVPVECAKQPPAYVRPGEMVPPEVTAYSFTELLKLGAP